MIFAFLYILSSILHVEMLLKVTYSAYKRKYYDSLLHFTMIYGEILKTGEKWFSMLRFLTFHGLFNADSKLPKNYYKLYGYPRDLSFRKSQF